MSREARRQRLMELRAAYPEALREGRGAALLDELAGEDPVLLVDLCLGPKAPRGAEAVAAALGVRRQLETQLPAKALAQRLVALSGLSPADPVLVWVLEEHLDADWAVRLFAEHASDAPALLAPHAGSLDLEDLLDGLVQLKADQVLLDVAGSGDTLPATLAWLRERRRLGLRLGARALSAGEPEQVFAELVAAWGPDVDALALGLLPHLGEGRVVRALLELVRPGGPAARMLRLVLPGLVEQGLPR